MKIGISTCAGDGGKSGISQYMIRILGEFEKNHPEHEFEAVVYPDEQDIFIRDPKRIKPILIDQRFRSPVLNIIWHQTVLPRICRERRFDALFLPAGNRRLCFHAPCPMVGTVHDFSNVHVQGKYDPARNFYLKWFLTPMIRRLSHVLTVSEASKRDIVRYARVPSDRVTVTYNGVNHQVFHPGAPDDSFMRISGRYGLKRPYVLYVSRIEHPGKNHVRLIHAFEKFKRTGAPHRLVLAGSDWSGADEVHAVHDRSPFKQDITFTGFLAAGDLPDLYRAAQMLVFPSLYEGFGLPVAEAMASGIPVACSDRSSLPEIAGDAAVLFDPHDEQAICRAIETLADERARAVHVEKGLAQSRRFDWAAAAAQTMNVLERAARGSR